MQIQKHLRMSKKRKKQELKALDTMMYVVSFVYPLTVAPQVYKVYQTHNVESLALVSWLLYLIFQLVCVAYAISRRLTPLIIEGSLWLVYYGLMVAAIMAYR